MTSAAGASHKNMAARDTGSESSNTDSGHGSHEDTASLQGVAGAFIRTTLLNSDYEKFEQRALKLGLDVLRIQGRSQPKSWGGARTRVKND